jgi:hypothetical protein
MSGMTEASTPGMATSRLSLRPAASTSITEAVSSALSRLASTAPADPAPRMR